MIDTTIRVTDPGRHGGGELWVKIVEMLQQNWARIEPECGGARVFFISDRSEIFDEIAFESAFEAEAALLRNGFERFGGSPDHCRFLRAPEPPYVRGEHPNGPIYSSGRFWI